MREQDYLNAKHLTLVMTARNMLREIPAEFLGESHPDFLIAHEALERLYSNLYYIKIGALTDDRIQAGKEFWI